MILYGKYFIYLYKMYINRNKFSPQQSLTILHVNRYPEVKHEVGETHDIGQKTTLGSGSTNEL